MIIATRCLDTQLVGRHIPPGRMSGCCIDISRYARFSVSLKLTLITPPVIKRKQNIMKMKDLKIYLPLIIYLKDLKIYLSLIIYLHVL